MNLHEFLMKKTSREHIKYAPLMFKEKMKKERRNAAFLLKNVSKEELEIEISNFSKEILNFIVYKNKILQENSVFSINDFMKKMIEV